MWCKSAAATPACYSAAISDELRIPRSRRWFPANGGWNWRQADIEAIRDHAAEKLPASIRNRAAHARRSASAEVVWKHICGHGRAGLCVLASAVD